MREFIVFGQALITKHLQKKELSRDYPNSTSEGVKPDFVVLSPLEIWYNENQRDVGGFEKQMRKKVRYVVKPEHLWSNITELARTHKGELLETLEEGFRYIENESFESSFQGLFSEINLNSEKLGRTPTERNKKLCAIIQKNAGIATLLSHAYWQVVLGNRTNQNLSKRWHYTHGDMFMFVIALRRCENWLSMRKSY